MKIRYELEDFSDFVCEEIANQLRTELIPHIFEKKSLVIDEINEDFVEVILSKIGTVDSLQDQQNSPWAPAKTTQEIINEYLEQTSLSTSTVNNMSYTPDDEPGTIASIGLFIGGGFGVLLVIGAFLDPTFEGRVYIFLPAIILGVLGFGIGYGIEKAIKQVRKKW